MIRTHAMRLAALALAALSLAAMPSASADDPRAPAPADEGNLGTVDGASIYAQLCQGCHMADGRGARGGGTYPSLADDNRNVASAVYVATVVLHGRRNMPAFAPELAPAPFFEPAMLSDAQVAAVVNHVRTHFGNDYPDPIAAADVAALHPARGE
jgi:mono/diheme cytochrome c family protein